MSMQLTQHRHLLSAAQAVTSEQQLVLLHATHAVSPGRGRAGAPELELDDEEVVEVAPLHAALQLPEMQALSVPVVPSTPMQVVLQRLSLPGFCWRQLIQHAQFVSARQATVSSQHDVLVHLVHAVSPGAAAHTPPELEELDVDDVLPAAIEPVLIAEPVVIADPVVIAEPVVIAVPPPPVAVAMAPDPVPVLVVTAPPVPPLSKATEPPPPQAVPSAAPPSRSDPTTHPSVRLSMSPPARRALSGPS